MRAPLRPNRLTNILAPSVWKYQSKFNTEAMMEKTPNTINKTIKDNFDDIFRQQSEYMSNYYEFVD